MSRIGHIAARVIAATGSVMAGAAGIATMVLTICITYAVFTRYVMRDPAVWPYELSEFVLVLMAAFAMAHVQLHRRHVRLDMVTTLLPEKTRKLVEVVSLVIFLGFMVIGVWASYLWAMKALEKGETGLLTHIPVAAVYGLIPVGFSVLCLQLLVDVTQSMARVLLGGNEEPRPDYGATLLDREKD